MKEATYTLTIYRADGSTTNRGLTLEKVYMAMARVIASRQKIPAAVALKLVQGKKSPVTVRGITAVFEKD